MKVLSAICIFSLLFFCIAGNVLCETGGQVPASSTGLFKISSPAFSEGQPIPKVYTCSGGNYSPQIQWANPPQGTKSFALVVDDPDAPGGTFTHWIIFNIAADKTSLDEKASPNGTLPAGSIEGRSDFGAVGYGGPCPPPGKAHRYFFKLYALDSTLSLQPGVKKDIFVKAIQSHIKAQAQMIGTFSR